MFMVSSCGSVATSLSAAERDRYQLSVLTLNLAGAEGMVDTVTVPWRTRYARVAQWAGATGNKPDLVFLQETVARKSFALGGGLNPHDYETLHYLIQQLDFRTGATYRIAYLATGGTALGLNYENSGQAMLYNADRLRKNIAKWDFSVTANRHTTLLWDRQFPIKGETLETGAVVQVPLDGERRVDEPEDGCGHDGPGEHPALFGEDSSPGGQLRPNDALGGDVAAAARGTEVLGEGPAGKFFHFQRGLEQLEHGATPRSWYAASHTS